MLLKVLHCLRDKNRGRECLPDSLLLLLTADVAAVQALSGHLTFGSAP